MRTCFAIIRSPIHEQDGFPLHIIGQIVEPTHVSVPCDVARVCVSVRTLQPFRIAVTVQMCAE